MKNINASPPPESALPPKKKGQPLTWFMEGLSDEVDVDAYIAGSPARKTKTFHHDTEANRPQETFDNEEDGDDDDDEGKPLLPPGRELVPMDSNIYSLIFTGALSRPGFWFALSIFGFQTIIMMLVLRDTLDFESDTNKLKMPAGNDIQVIIAQGMLMFLLPQLSDDMMESIEVLIDGYDHTVLDRCPNATKWKWALSGCLHFGVGALMTFDVFAIIMQQTSVLNLGFTYLAFDFFADIDNTAFEIGKKGVCSVPLRDDIEACDEVEVTKTTAYTWHRRIRDTLLTAALMVGWAVLTYQQIEGKFVCHSVLIQFGDIFNPEIAGFFGIFDMLGVQDQHDRRAVYQERSTGLMRLMFCADQKQWTLSAKKKDGTFDPCDKDTIWAAASPPDGDDGYDILQTAGGWQVNPSVGGPMKPFTHFLIKCNECDGNCDHGKCEEDVCVCDHHHYGVNCEFTSPCSNITVNQNTALFPVAHLGMVTFPTEWDLLKLSDGSKMLWEHDNHVLQVEYRPVYFGKNDQNRTFLMFFAGRRFAIVDEIDGMRLPNKTAAVDYLTGGKFNVITSSFSPYYLSAAMDVDQPDERASPDKISWYRVRTSQATADDDADTDEWWQVALDLPIETMLHCALCDDSNNPCQNWGSCKTFTNESSTGYCECPQGTLGSLCEYDEKCTDIDPPAFDDDTTGDDDDNTAQWQCFYGTCQSDGSCSGCPVGMWGARCGVPIPCSLAAKTAVFDESYSGDTTDFNGCFRGGTCNKHTGVCDCPAPYVGRLCQFPNDTAITGVEFYYE